MESGGSSLQRTIDKFSTLLSILITEFTCLSKTITISGAAGQIGYQLAFRIASGQLLGLGRENQLKDYWKSLLLINALNGVAMELDDSAFPLS